MDEEESIEKLLNELFDLSQGEVNLSTLQQTGQIMLTKIQHQINTAFITIVRSLWCRETGESRDVHRGAMV